MRNDWKRNIAGFMLLVMVLVYLPTSVAEAAMYQKGAKGTSVQYLQQNLTFLGFSTNGADGVFGNNTKNAVLSLQKALHMEETGIVDDDLDALIKGTIRDIQMYLQKKGYYLGELDGIKGNMMAVGYKKLQKELGYKQTGIFDFEVAKLILQDEICAGELISLQEYVKHVETLDGSAGKGITCNRSVNLAELTDLVNSLVNCERYNNTESLLGTSTNITIKSVYASIKSLMELVTFVNNENVEINIFVAGYNNDAAELAKYKKFFDSMNEYLVLQKEYFTEYRDALEAAPYWVKHLNISNVVDIVNDCDKLIRCIDNVLNENLYVVQVENGRNAANQIAMNVVELAIKDYNNTPRYIPGGTPYNGITNNGTEKKRSWCVDYVQYILEQAGKNYFNAELCGAVDKLAIQVSKYGGILYVTCKEDYKYFGSSARISLQSDTYYQNNISMNFEYDTTMKVQPGDIIIYGRVPEYRFAHVGLCVETFENGCYKTIEGNTGWNSYGDQCLNQKERDLNWSRNGYYILGVLRPNYAGTITASDVE